MKNKSEAQAIRHSSRAILIVVILEIIFLLPVMWWFRGLEGLWGAAWGSFGVVLLALSGLAQIFGLMKFPFFVMPIAMFSFLLKVVVVLAVGISSQYLPICEKCALIVLLVGVLSILLTEAVSLYRHYPTVLETNLTDESQLN